MDLHGAPGSQNGFDNSGISCSSIVYSGKCAANCQDIPRWSLDQKNIDFTLEVLEEAANLFKDYPNIYGLELVNEPFWGTNITVLQNFYRIAYERLRAIVPTWKITMHDSFRYQAWEGFMKDSTKYHDVVLDTHLYLAFLTDVMKMNEKDRISVII